jgi:hypothetical protein
LKKIILLIIVIFLFGCKKESEPIQKTNSVTLKFDGDGCEYNILTYYDHSRDWEQTLCYLTNYEITFEIVPNKPIYMKVVQFKDPYYQNGVFYWYRCCDDSTIMSLSLYLNDILYKYVEGSDSLKIVY